MIELIKKRVKLREMLKEYQRIQKQIKKNEWAKYTDCYRERLLKQEEKERAMKEMELNNAS